MSWCGLRVISLVIHCYYSYPWLSVVISVVIIRYPWLSVVIACYLLLSLVIHGRLSLVIVGYHGYPWLYILCGCPWFSSVIACYHWLYLWLSLVIVCKWTHKTCLIRYGICIYGIISFLCYTATTIHAWLTSKHTRLV